MLILTLRTVTHVYPYKIFAICFFLLPYHHYSVYKTAFNYFMNNQLSTQCIFNFKGDYPRKFIQTTFTPRNRRRKRKSELSQWIGYYALVVFKKVRNKTLFFSSIIYTFLAPQNQWHYNCKPFYGNDILLCIKVFCIPREEPFVNSRNH